MNVVAKGALSHSQLLDGSSQTVDLLWGILGRKMQNLHDLFPELHGAIAKHNRLVARSAAR